MWRKLQNVSTHHSHDLQAVIQIGGGYHGGYTSALGFAQDPQMFFQAVVGDNVNPRIVIAAEIDWYPIGFFVVQGSQNPLA